LKLVSPIIIDGKDRKAEQNDKQVEHHPKYSAGTGKIKLEKHFLHVKETIYYRNNYKRQTND
jgi:hypothetical protein